MHYARNWQQRVRSSSVGRQRGEDTAVAFKKQRSWLITRGITLNIRPGYKRLYEEQILSVIESGVNCRISIFVHSKSLLFV